MFMTEHSGSTRQPDDLAPDDGTPEAGSSEVGAAGAKADRPNSTAETASAAKPTVYRGAMALAGAVIVAVICVAGVLDLLIEAGTQDLLGAAILLLVAVLAVGYGIYPAAFAYEDRLTVRNPFRTITLPWAAVTEINARLSFVVHADDQRYTIWAIPVSMHDRRKAERDRMKEMSRASRDASRRARGGRSRLPEFPGMASRPVDPIEKLSYADQALHELRERREAEALRIKNAAALARKQSGKQNGKQGGDETGPKPAVSVRWTWPMPVAAGCAILLVALVAILK